MNLPIIHYRQNPGFYTVKPRLRASTAPKNVSLCGAVLIEAPDSDIYLSLPFALMDIILR